MLGEPTNDLDIDTLNVIEDHLDSWPGTLLVVSHDRYFLERVCDVSYALMGDGRCVLLPGGVEQYLEHRRRAAAAPVPETTGSPAAAPTPGPGAAQRRQATKDLARVETRLDRLHVQIADLHEQMGRVASDHVRLAELGTELEGLRTQESELEEQWRTAAEQLG